MQFPISDLSDDEFERELLASTDERAARLRAELNAIAEFRARLAEHIKRREAATHDDVAA